jgi:predicted Ser/Thr protein kinase
LDEREIACKLPCELREHPLFLLPPEERRKLFEELIAAKPDDELLARRLRGPWLRAEGLSAKSRAIYDALLNVHQGDWRAVMRCVQVERWFVSRRYRQGAASVEPQQAVDAGARPLTFEQGPVLPAALHGLQLFTLFGELADASGGVIDYADFLKRPLELNKYLLSACEQGAVPVSGINADLNVVFFGTCNEKQLSAFKALPDFPSYMGRIELLRVPYLLVWSKEAELYRRWLTEIAETRHVAPHTAALTAIWAALTRVRRPDPGKYPDQAIEIVKNLAPLEKVNFYNDGSLPDRLTSEERRELAAEREVMTSEYDDAMAVFEDFPDAAYEGRRGASAREIKALLAEAAAEAERPCLSPTGVFAAMEKLSHHKTVYEFLRLEVEGAYHDAPALLDAVREEYLRRITVEVYDSLGLVAAEEYERRVREYFHHVRAYVSGEKVRREADGALMPPSEDVMTGIEKHLALKESADLFRRNLVGRIAAFALDNPNEKIDYLSVCSNFFGNLKRSYYEEKRRQLERLAKPIPLLGTEEEKTLTAAEKKQAETALKTLCEKYGYCSHCAREAVTAVLRAIVST